MFKDYVFEGLGCCHGSENEYLLVYIHRHI